MRISWVFVILVPIVICGEDTVNNFSPEWVYTCVPDQGCQRADGKSTLNTTKTYYSSLNLCRTVCGQFGGLWPRPVSAVLSLQTVQIHPNYLRYDLLDTPVVTRELLVQMTQVTTANLVLECGGKIIEEVQTPVVVYISVESPNMDLTWDTDEEYNLDVQTKQEDIVVRIAAKTVYGARHALESFTQLVASNMPDYSDQSDCSLFLVSAAKIKDRPVYKHRGLLLDTSRNFIPMENIKRTIDGMAATKMNVFHWHVTDSQSFPLESRRVPQLTRYGAYSGNEIYSTEEVRDLIKYARARGVRVVIEIDSPAHAGNGWQWGKEYGYGDLAVCVNARPWRNYCIQPPCGQLNPANPQMYHFLGNLYQDLAEVLPQPALLHMGGDEVFLNCWNSSEEIIKYMAQQGYKRDHDGFLNLWAEFHRKALKAWDDALEALGLPAGQQVILWSSELTKAERITRHLDKNRYVIEVWDNVNSYLLTDLLKLGYQTINVPRDIWYLDHGVWGQTQYSNWRRMYSHTLPKYDTMLGGEVAMWSEYIDEQSLDPRVWPRAAAVAERLWSDPNTDANLAEPRIQRMRERMILRGLRPDAIAPHWCAQNAGRCLPGR